MLRLRLVRALLGILIAGSCSAKLIAQASGSPAFEVASVRLNRSDAPAYSLFPLGPGDAYVAGNLFSATNQPLIVYLRFAYKLGQSDLTGLPGWVYNDRFDIEARAAGNPAKDEMRLMMRSLLADRFKVTTRMAQQTRPVFNLVLANARRTGPQLLPHPGGGDCPPAADGLRLPSIPCGSIGQISASTPDKGRIGGRAVSIGRLAAILMNPFTGVDRPVLDRTGLAGTFDLSIEWSLARDSAQPPDTTQRPASQPDDAGPGFREALQKQLGLKLVSATAPVDVLVIDRIQHPDEN